MRITHTWTDETATIRVEGLNQTVRMLQVTDSHIALIDDRDAEHLETCQRSCQKFESTDVIFDETMTEAKKLDLDLIALTGDIVHFPSQASVEKVAGSIAKVNVPVWYTAGNHDWNFDLHSTPPGLEGREELREAWWPVLKPLHHNQAAYARYEIGGIQFLLVDDSTYQINEEQLAFVQSHLADGMPTVLLLHIPLSIATLRDRAIARYKAPILIGDPDWDMESRNQWETGADLPSTLAFVRTLAAAENLVAVFCGHIHFPHTDAVSPHAVQYVGVPGYDGGKRLVEFCPL